MPYGLKVSYGLARSGISHSPLESSSTPCITWPFSYRCTCSRFLFAWQFSSTSKRLRVSSPLTACLLKWHRGIQHSPTAAVLSRHFSDLVLRLLLWEVCAKAENFHFSLPLVPIQMMLYTHREICTALYIFKFPLYSPHENQLWRRAGCLYG